MKRFTMTLPDDITALLDTVRNNDPSKLSRRQIITKIIVEWMEWKGVGKDPKKSKIEQLEKELAQLKNA